MEQKVLHCKAVRLFSSAPTAGRNLNILEAVKECHVTMEIKDRIVDVGLLGDYHVSQHFRVVNDDIFVHVVKANQDGAISIVPKPKPKQVSSDLEELAAPKIGDFLQDECFVYIFGDFAIYLNAGISADAAAKYLSELAAKKSLINSNEWVKFQNIANTDAIRKIREHKIRSLTVGANLDAPTWISSTPQVSKLADAMRSIIFNDPADDKTAPNNYKYTLSISAKGKLSAEEIDPLTAKGAAIYQELDSNEGSQVKLDIVLGNGESMNLREVALNRTIGVTRMGSGLDKDKVLREMIEYKEKLVKDRAIDKA